MEQVEIGINFLEREIERMKEELKQTKNEYFITWQRGRIQGTEFAVNHIKSMIKLSKL